MTYFKKLVGRACDGRLIIDFIGSDYKHGANFATLASTVLLPQTSLFVTGVSPFSLAIQLNQTREFKYTVLQQQKSHSKPSGKPYVYCVEGSSIPSGDIFGKSVYTLYIWQNDFTGKLSSLGIQGVQQFLSQVISQIIDTIKVSNLEGHVGASIKIFLASNSFQTLVRHV
ncbi:hypothetical protein V2J09_016457 [Rumex salicifolius]